MDLRGCEGGGGVFEDLVLVVVLAVGEVFGGERSDGVGDVLVVVEGEEGGVGGDDFCADGFGG